MHPQSRFIKAIDGHELHYLEWGTKAASPGNKTVVMIHGLTRTGGDFIPLASHLHSALGGLHCVSFDVIGRGLSTWAKGQAEADAEYTVPYYIKLFAGIFAAMGLKEDYYVGTSMGGIIGFVGLGTGAFSPFFSKILMNDIGPYVPMAALRNIGRYSAAMPVYGTAGEVMGDLRKRMATFGEFTDADHLRWSIPYVRRLADGQFTFHYDEKILDGIRKLIAGTDSAKGSEAVVGIAADLNDAEAKAEAPSKTSTPAEDEETKMRAAAEPLWALFKNISIPIMLVRGANSELLLSEDAARMIEMKEAAGNNALLHVVPNCGHAPMLVRDEDFAAIAAFFTA